MSAGTGRTAPWVTLLGHSSFIEVDFCRGHCSAVTLPLLYIAITWPRHPPSHTAPSYTHYLQAGPRHSKPIQSSFYVSPSLSLSLSLSSPPLFSTLLSVWSVSQNFWLKHFVWSAVLRLSRSKWLGGNRWGTCILVWLGLNLFWFFARTAVVLLVPFCFPDKTINLSCNNAVFTFGLLAISAYLICLRNGMKIKLQILTENIEMLPDKIEMSVLTASSYMRLTLWKRCHKYYCSRCVVVANRGLHPTKFTKPLLYKTKNFITLSLLNIISSYFIPFDFCLF